MGCKDPRLGEAVGTVEACVGSGPGSELTAGRPLGNAATCAHPLFVSSSFFF